MSSLPPPPNLPPPPPPTPPPPPVDPIAPERRGGKKAGLLIVTGLVAIVVLAVAATESDDDPPEAQMTDPLPAAAPTTETNLDPGPTASSVPPSSEATRPETSGPAPTSEVEPRTAWGEPDEVDDVSSCTWTGDEVTIALVNNSSTTSTYWVTTAYLDADGRRVADEIHFVNAVRSNETAFEVSPSLEHATPTCEVIDVQRWAEESDPAEMQEIGACEMEAPDIFGHASARLTATNGSAKISDYLIKVAFVNAGGFRIGSGTALVDSVRPGESAPGDVFSLAAPEGIARCDVVAVERTASR